MKMYFKRNQRVKPYLSLLKEWSLKTPGKETLITPGQDPISFLELYRYIIRLRSDFSQAGITPFDRVGLWISDPLDFAVIALAAASGVACIPIYSGITSTEAKDFFTRTRMTWLIADGNSPVFIKEIAEELGIRVIYLLQDHETVPKSFMLSFSNTASMEVWPEPSLNGCAFIIQTTGSTATPKLVMLSHGRIIENMLLYADEFKVTSEDRYLNFMPVNHVTGLLGVISSLVFGGSTVLVQRFESRSFFHWLKEFKPSCVAATPTLYKEIIKSVEYAGFSQDDSSLRFLETGSAPMPAYLFRQLEDFFRVPLIESYGMSEVMGIATNSPDKRKLGSVGKPLGVKLVIHNSRHEKCKPFETGSILVSSKTITPDSVYFESDASSSFYKEWFITGDLGYLDEEGYLFLAGREKEMINKGGEKISTLEIENELLKHPGIMEAVVFPVPHPDLGEEIAAAVLSRGSMEISETEVKTFLREHLSFHKIPVRIIFVPEIPHFPNGKAARKQLALSLLDQIFEEQRPVNQDFLTWEEQFVAGWFAKIRKQSVMNSDADFFAIGGTSLEAADLITEIGNEMGIKIDILLFMKNPTVKGFSQKLRENYPYHLEKIFGDKISNYASGMLSELPRYGLSDTDQFNMNVLEPQKKFISSWKGIRMGNDSLILGKNTDGEKIPLFWCFQGFEEFSNLSEKLGPGQSVYGMRSGHLLIREDFSQMKMLADLYTAEIIKIKTEGPIILGGNCQGAWLIWEIARCLVEKGYNIPLLCIMEANIKLVYKGKIALFYGSESLFNPYKIDPNPEKAWNRLYGSYSVDLLTGEHGSYFSGTNLDFFSTLLAQRLDEVTL